MGPASSRSTPSTAASIFPPTSRAALSFQDWLDKWYGSLSIILREHPTCDFKPVPLETFEAVSRDICGLASGGRTVVLVDSGGVTRTGMVCRHISAIEDSSSDNKK
jgi:hypothetical protein